VAVATFYIAIKAGSKESIFVVQNLEFLVNRSHAGLINDVPEYGVCKKSVEC
jgi:hypothetical protein